ncbi:DUF4271 domain-containing protein [Parafilimonas sp.]|uniref:DUF4271 domain-containing protein n=1 Tax=Parafilimonas sp. TaxID=1969739 RepID=UPI003F7E7B46
MKHLSVILFFLILPVFLLAQDTGSRKKINDTNARRALHDTIIPGKLTDTGIRKKKNDTGIQKKLNDTIQAGQIKKNVATLKDSGAKATVKKIDSVKDSTRVLIVKPNIADSLQRDSLQSDSLKHDSIRLAATAAAKRDSLAAKKIKLMPGVEKAATNTDEIFYILIFILFFLSLIKAAFPKYFDSLFTLSFQATFRQTQTREQMAQNFFPAFMLNILFALCGGVFITLYAGSEKWSSLPFWELFVYSTGILLLAYSVKYLVISFTGWVFNAKEAATEYRFVVFLVNKLLGILVIPLLFLIAYSNDRIKSIAITIVLCLVVFSLAVRYIVSLARIRKNLSVTAFHFFVYLCAVEIIPLLVIYKVLFQQTSIR